MFPSIDGCSPEQKEGHHYHYHHPQAMIMRAGHDGGPRQRSRRRALGGGITIIMMRKACDNNNYHSASCSSSTSTKPRKEIRGLADDSTWRGEGRGCFPTMIFLLMLMMITPRGKMRTSMGAGRQGSYHIIIPTRGWWWSAHIKAIPSISGKQTVHGLLSE